MTTTTTGNSDDGHDHCDRDDDDNEDDHDHCDPEDDDCYDHCCYYHNESRPQSSRHEHLPNAFDQNHTGLATTLQ